MVKEQNQVTREDPENSLKTLENSWEISLWGVRKPSN